MVYLSPRQLINSFKELTYCHGSIKRLIKDVMYYEKEEADISAKLKEAKNDSEYCPSQMKYNEESLEETLRALSTVRVCLTSSVDKLYFIVNTKFPGILAIKGQLLEFCEPYISSGGKDELDKLEDKYPGFTMLYEEVNKINVTLLKAIRVLLVDMPNNSNKEVWDGGVINPEVDSKGEHADI